MSFSNSQRGNGRITINAHNLPIHSSALEEKLHGHGHARSVSWATPVSLPIPGVRTRRLRIWVPTFGRRRRTPLLFLALCVAGVFAFVTLSRRSDGRPGDVPHDEPPTLVFPRPLLRQVWEWEVASGHYPSRRSIPLQVGLTTALPNPALPPRPVAPPPRFRPPPSLVAAVTDTKGTGLHRVYPDIYSKPPNVAYPPRPIPGSVADLDAVMNHCDFSEYKYVRDCLEVLRIGAGLDNGNRLRRGELEDWKYIYTEHENATAAAEPAPSTPRFRPIAPPVPVEHAADSNAGLVKKPDAEWEARLDVAPARPPARRPAGACDPEHPRLFHMFWTGPFTDKPYNALLSFLFTQNTGLHQRDAPADVCRPQFWLWINPGPAASVPNPSAMADMFETLKSNAWSAPFLHPRFRDVIQFKLWNTTEQLDGVPELKDEWRALSDNLFNSGGYVISVPKKAAAAATGSANATATATDDDDLLNRTGSKSSDSYDRLSVILSDMARFVLCHRFGGVYLDADTIFLRDWEELWGWQGAFAYRWSRLEKYNTAVLRLHKGSALGTFLFRTALKNGLDFHPMTVSRYTRDAHLEGLLLRLPDALFDSAWLNTEVYQRERPPQPYFTQFADFFDTPAEQGAAPQAVGFEGFFRGAYSYHFHNFWWKPFDPARNWPDLGPRFAVSERPARAAALAQLNPSGKDAEGWADRVENDRRDLGWAAVLKRTFEAYVRGERPNMYGEWIHW